jgi:transposase
MKILSPSGLAITKDIQDKIVELHLQGLSLRKIEVELNITRPTVTKYIKKHKESGFAEENKITSGKPLANINQLNEKFKDSITEAKQNAEQIKNKAYNEWKNSTLSQKEIAQKYGISTPTFCKYVKKWKVTGNEQEN